MNYTKINQYFNVIFKLIILFLLLGIGNKLDNLYGSLAAINNDTSEIADNTSTLTGALKLIDEKLGFIESDVVFSDIGK